MKASASSGKIARSRSKSPEESLLITVGQQHRLDGGFKGGFGGLFHAVALCNLASAIAQNSILQFAFRQAPPLAMGYFFGILTV